MSGKSGSMRSCGSVRLAPSSGHEVVLDALYERKRDKKTVRVLTVIVYVFCVSLAAIMLSLYYVFFWEPKEAHYAQRKVAHNVERQTTTTPMPTCFLPHTERGNTTVSEVFSTQAPPVVTDPDLSTSTQDVNNMTDPDPTREFFNATSDGIGLYNETNIT